MITKLYFNQSCLKTCYQNHVIDACSCTDAYFPDGAAFNRSELPVCSVTNITQGKNGKPTMNLYLKCIFCKNLNIFNFPSFFYLFLSRSFWLSIYLVLTFLWCLQRKEEMLMFEIITGRIASIVSKHYISNFFVW